MANLDEQLQISNSDDFTVSLDVNSVVESWLTRTFNSSLKRSSDIRNDKSRAVFEFCSKRAEQVLPSDVEEWRWSLRNQNLADGSVYNRISALAQFFEYLRNEIGMIKLIPINPARVSLPKANKPFQSESVKALSREEPGKLLEVVGGPANGKQPVHLRDHALLQFYVATGDLAATGRDNIFGKDEPLWLRHDKGAGSNNNLTKKKALTSHDFARRMEIYALEAGIRHFHTH